MTRYAALCLVIPLPLVLTGHRGTNFDVDVESSAGSPMEWLNDIPKPIISLDRTRARPRKGNETRVATQGVPLPYRNGNLFSFFRVTTPDLLGEISWAGATKYSGSRDYPPVMTVDVYWQAVVILLRRLLRPAELNEGEAIQLLIYLGEPAVAAVEASQGESSLRSIRDAVRKAVGTMPPDPPASPQGKTPFEIMMRRLTVEDLVSDYPFAITRPFAPRISLLGDEALPYAIEAAKSDHSFLRRNATLWIAQSSSPHAMAALREVFSSTNDPVVRNRCLEAFARWRDTTVVEELIGQLKTSTDASYRCYLAYVLGRIGDRRATRAIVDLLQANRASFDIAMSAVAALARLRDNRDGAALRAVRVVASQSYKDPVSKYNPPVDRTIRRTIAHQLTTIAAAQLTGSDEHQKALLKLLLPKPPEPSNDWRSTYDRGLLRNFYPPCIYLAIDALCSFEKGLDAVRTIVRHQGTDESLRAYASSKLVTTSPPDIAEFQRALANLDAPQPLAEIALATLRTYDPLAARDAARAIVRKAHPTLDAGSRYVVAIAAQILAASNTEDRDALIRAVECELIAMEMEERKLMQRPNLERLDFHTRVPAIERFAVDLGGLSDPRVQALLDDLVGSRTTRGRAEACVGLARMGGAPALARIVRCLEDSDGWVRFVAARCLEEVSGHELKLDWIWGDVEARDQAVERMRDWLKNAASVTLEGNR